MKIENRVSCEGNWKVSVVKQIHFYLSFFHRTRINLNFYKFLQKQMHIIVKMFSFDIFVQDFHSFQSDLFKFNFL